MSRPKPTDNQIHAASQATTEYLSLAFEAEFLRWERDVNLQIAELVWNHHTAVRATGEDGELGVVPDLEPLRRHLAEARKLRWEEADWMVFSVEARVDDGNIVFSFELWWDELEFCQPCEMTWMQRTADARHLN